MHRTVLHRSGLTLVALILAWGLTACGTDGDSATRTSSPTSSASTGTADRATGEFGPACDLVPTSGAGSFEGMSSAPVASAAGANPVLSTLVTAVKAAGLVDTLNNAQDITVLAPSDPAFARVPEKDLAALLKDKPRLTQLLSHHVLEGRLTPEQLPGSHRTMAGDTVDIEGSGESFTVNSTKAQPQAHVVCGNITTANATVYVVDHVLAPGK